MGFLSRERAVALSADLAELVIRIQCLQQKYGIEDDLEPGPSLRPLLGALQPFAFDPKVAAITQAAGFTLGQPVSGTPLMSARQVTEDSTVLDLSTDQHSRATTEDFTALEAPTAWHSRAATEESVAPPVEESLRSAGTVSGQATEGSARPSSRSMRKVSVVPAHSARPRPWTYSLEHDVDAPVRDVRRQLGILMRLPVGKVRLLGQRGQDFAVLDDSAKAALATRVVVLNVAAAVQSSSTAAPPLVMDKKRALGLQLDILASLDAHQQQQQQGGMDRRGLILTVQAYVLPKYGFSASPAGTKRMLQAFDQHVGDADIERVGEAISDKLGMPPQAYELHNL